MFRTFTIATPFRLGGVGLRLVWQLQFHNRVVDGVWQFKKLGQACRTFFRQSSYLAANERVTP